MDHPFSDSNQFDNPGIAKPRIGELGAESELSDCPPSSMSPMSISNWIEQIGLGFRNICQRHNIEIAMDLEEITDTVEPKPIKDAVIAMVNNAIEAMPNGGDLEITLIDGDHQWEIEVADSGVHRSQLPRDRGTRAASEGSVLTAKSDLCDPASGQSTQASSPSQLVGLPKVEPAAPTRHLQNMEKLAFELGATLQAWNCPLGGTAHVMIVPKQQYPKTNQDNQTSGMSTSSNDGLPYNDQREAA